MSTTTDTSDLLQWLCRWVESQCNDDWEHGHAFNLGMFDNPGWRLEVHLVGTSLENVPFVTVKEGEVDDEEWLHCKVKDNVFEVACHLQRLPDALRIFRSWVEAHGQA